MPEALGLSTNASPVEGHYQVLNTRISHLPQDLVQRDGICSGNVAYRGLDSLPIQPSGRTGNTYVERLAKFVDELFPNENLLEFDPFVDVSIARSEYEVLAAKWEMFGPNEPEDELEHRKNCNKDCLWCRRFDEARRRLFVKSWVRSLVNAIMGLPMPPVEGPRDGVPAREPAGAGLCEEPEEGVADLWLYRGRVPKPEELTGKVVFALQRRDTDDRAQLKRIRTEAELDRLRGRDTVLVFSDPTLSLAPNEADDFVPYSAGESVCPVCLTAMGRRPTRDAATVGGLAEEQDEASDGSETDGGDSPVIRLAGCTHAFHKRCVKAMRSSEADRARAGETFFADPRKRSSCPQCRQTYDSYYDIEDAADEGLMPSFPLRAKSVLFVFSFIDTFAWGLSRWLRERSSGKFSGVSDKLRGGRGEGKWMYMGEDFFNTTNGRCDSWT